MVCYQKDFLTKEDIAENKRNKKMLTEAISSGRTLLFLGTGCSVRAGYPTWSALIEKLEAFAGDGFVVNKEMRNNDFLKYVDEIKEYLCVQNKGDGLEKYHNFLSRIFNFKSEKEDYDEIHSIFIRLPFKGILTTNYDHAIERASQDRNKYSHTALIIEEDSKMLLSDFFVSLDFPEKHEKNKQVLHLHGTFKRASKIILSQKEYLDAYGFPISADETEGDARKRKWTLHRKIIWAILATRCVVFVGFSFNDPYFKAMLEVVARDLRMWWKSVHYAIMPVSSSTDLEEKKRYREKFGIETIFYPEDKNHVGLKNIIDEVAVACNVRCEEENFIDKIDKLTKQMEIEI